VLRNKRVIECDFRLQLVNSLTLPTSRKLAEKAGITIMIVAGCVILIRGLQMTWLLGFGGDRWWREIQRINAGVSTTKKSGRSPTWPVPTPTCVSATRQEPHIRATSNTTAASRYSILSGSTWVNGGWICCPRSAPHRPVLSNVNDGQPEAAAPKSLV
jgi:hypothetical protein